MLTIIEKASYHTDGLAFSTQAAGRRVDMVAKALLINETLLTFILALKEKRRVHEADSVQISR